MKTSSDALPEPIAVSPAKGAKLVDVGRSTLYEALRAGELKSMKIGRRRLILVEDLKAWLVSHRVG